MCFHWGGGSCSYHHFVLCAQLVREIGWSHNITILEKCRSEQEAGVFLPAVFGKASLFGYIEEDPETMVPGSYSLLSAEQLVERDQDFVIDAKHCFLRLRSGLLLQFRSGEVDIHRG